MRIMLAIAITIAMLSTAGSARAGGPARPRLDGEIHTTFQPLLWARPGGQTALVRVSAQGEVTVTGVGKDALAPLRAAATRLHQRYGGRRAISVRPAGDNLEVTVGASARSQRQAQHHLSVYGTGGGFRQAVHTMSGAQGVRTRSGSRR